MKYLAFIPARSGSKGIPGKNKMLLQNKPLITYTFESATHSKLIDEIHLSSDDEDIMDLALSHHTKVLYKRPQHIAEDTTSIYEVLLYHIDFLKKNGMELPQYIVLLQPTSPLRGEKLIDKCITAFEKSGAESLAAVSKALQHPYEMFRRQQGKNIFISSGNQQRQEYPEYYFITGSVYIASLDFILREKKFFNDSSAIYVVEPFEAVDIDDETDVDLALYYLKKTE
ncbi:MAG: acylneuraminate cytidylyltransferase family protein [Bacteroidota bacterium]